MHPSEPLHTSHPVHPAEPTDPLDRLARKRAGAKLGWYLHATLYVLVNVVLALLSSVHGKHWAIFPALGWAVGCRTAAFSASCTPSNTFARWSTFP